MRPVAALLVLLLVIVSGCGQDAPATPKKLPPLTSEQRGKWVAASIELDGFKWLEMPAEEKLECCCSLLGQSDRDEKAGGALSRAIDDFYADPLRRKLTVNQADAKLRH